MVEIEIPPWMDNKTLLETAPFVQGRLRDQREEICTGYVEWAISSEECSDQFEVGDIINIIKEKTDIVFEEIQVKSVLERLVDEDIVSHESGNSYLRSGEREFESVDELIEECWEDFTVVLDEHPRDVDIHFIDSNMEAAFRDFLEIYAEELEEETEILEETKQDVIYTSDISDTIDEVIQEQRLNEPGIFKESLVEFLQNPSDSLKEYVGVIYIAIINSDLLKKQRSIDLPEIPEDEKKIFFDSNVIQNLLCEEDNEHPLIRTIVDRSNELDFDLYYYPETVDDLQRSIDGAVREMSGLKGSNYSAQTFENQFVKDWHEKFKKNGMEWGEYRSTIQRWQFEVEALHDIVELEEEVECPEEEFEYAEDIINRIDSRRHKEPKKPKVIKHDASILAKTSVLRESASGNHNIGPLMISLDNSVTQASDYAYQEGDWNEGISIPPRVWFNYLLSFTSAEIKSVEIGDVILNVSANIPSQPTIKEYSKAVEEKAGLDSDDSELLARYLKYSTYSSEIERSLRDDDGSADEWAFKALTNQETMEQFTEHKEQKKRIRNMGQRIQELEEQNRTLREGGQNEETHNYFVGGNAEAHGGDTEVQANSEAEASATAGLSADLQQEFDGFIDLYYENVPEEIKKEIPPAPEDESNLKEVKNWLDIVTTVLAVAEPSTAALTAVSKYGDRLLNEISEML